MCNSVGITRLRNSFSFTSNRYFDQIEPQMPVPVKQKRKTFHNLKSTIDDINRSLHSAQKGFNNNKVNMLKNKSTNETPIK